MPEDALDTCEVGLPNSWGWNGLSELFRTLALQEKPVRRGARVLGHGQGNWQEYGGPQRAADPLELQAGPRLICSFQVQPVARTI